MIKERPATLDRPVTRNGSHADDANGSALPRIDEATIRDCVERGRDYLQRVRHWIEQVFRDRIECDPETELTLREEGETLLVRAQLLLQSAHANYHVLVAEQPNDAYLSVGALQATYDELKRFQSPWLTPKRSVSPGPRNNLAAFPEYIEYGRAKLAELIARNQAGNKAGNDRDRES